MKVSVYNQAGEVVDQLELSDAVFGVPLHMSLMHQVVVAQQANARVGTASTKTRAQVAGTTKKMYKQKGTGRARHGSRKVPLWRGGGVAHGPHPRSYEQHTPKKMRRAAIRSALSVKARDNQIILLQDVSFERPRTKEMAGLLGRLPITGKVLLTLHEADPNVLLSARNLPGVDTLPALSLNTLDLIHHDYLVATVPAIRAVEQWLTTGAKGAAVAETAPAPDEAPAEAVPARRRTRAAAATAPTAAAEATPPAAAAEAAAPTAPAEATAPAAAEDAAPTAAAGTDAPAGEAADDEAAPKRARGRAKKDEATE